MYNKFHGQTEDELITLRDSLIKRSTTGVISMTTGAGLQQMRSWQGSAPVDVEIKRVYYALFLLNPDAYPNPYAAQVKASVPKYL